MNPEPSLYRTILIFDCGAYELRFWSACCIGFKFNSTMFLKLFRNLANHICAHVLIGTNKLLSDLRSFCSWPFALFTHGTGVHDLCLTGLFPLLISFPFVFGAIWNALFFFSCDFVFSVWCVLLWLLFSFDTNEFRHG